MCPTERALVAAVCAEPYDDTPRLVYADWLDEQDSPTVLCGRCSSGYRISDCPMCGYGPDTPPGNRTVLDVSRKRRAELIRLQHALPGLPPTMWQECKISAVDWEGGKYEKEKDEKTVERIDFDPVKFEYTVRFTNVTNPEIMATKLRIGEIVAHAREREWFLPPGCHTMAVTAETQSAPRPFDAIDATTRQYDTYSYSWHNRVRLVVDRGFVGGVYCEMETWTAQLAPSLYYVGTGELADTAQPVTRVYFTDQPVSQVREMDVGLRSMWPTVRFGWFDQYSGKDGLIERPAKVLRPIRKPPSGYGGGTRGRK
jgi:uncharacterized protein (TIGR02996 family)